MSLLTSWCELRCYNRMPVDLAIDVGAVAAAVRACASARSLAGRTAADTGVAGAELAGGGAVLLVARVAAAVLAAVLALGARRAVGTALAATTGDLAGLAGGALVGGGDDLGGEVEVLAEVVEALRGERVEVPLPAELRLDEALGGERLARLDDLQVGDLELRVLDLKVLGATITPSLNREL